MKRPHILVVEDDDAIAQSVYAGLEGAGYAVRRVCDGAAAFTAVASHRFDVIILDLGLPELDGQELLEQWTRAVPAPIIVVSARADLKSRLAAFGNGAADFVPKPFFMEELLARVRARLPAADTTERVLQFAAVTLDPVAETLTVDGLPVELKRQELRILTYLVRRPGSPVTRHQLARFAIPSERDRSDRVVDTYIARIRAKLGDSACHIRTVWGLGYRFDPAGESS